MQNRQPNKGCLFASVKKALWAFFDSSLQSAARIICLLLADKFHTCSLISILGHVHAAAQNVITFFAYAKNSAKLS